MPEHLIMGIYNAHVSTKKVLKVPYKSTTGPYYSISDGPKTEVCGTPALMLNGLRCTDFYATQTFVDLQGNLHYCAGAWQLNESIPLTLRM